MTESTCTYGHKFVFLRQDKTNEGYDRAPVYRIDDLFFCERCLTYRRVGVRKETPRQDSFDDPHVMRLV